MPYKGMNVVSGAGTLYAAPLGTAEPQGVSAAWPAGWVPLGYTAQGSTFQIKPTAASILVEEEYWPVRNVITGYEGHLMFNLAETTFQNWMLALNAGITGAQLTAAHGTNTDGSTWVEIPDVGTEARVMLGWDSLSEGTIAGQITGRLIVRQAFQIGQVQTTRRKGSNIADIACDFEFEKPPGIEPFRILIPSTMQS